jgi:Uncharacterized phage-associated protein
MENIIDVAQYIYEEYKRQSGEIIDEMKLHKLLYFVQREALAITGEELFSENFEGWKYGPVCTNVRSLYTDEGMYSDNIKDISSEAAYISKNIIMQYGVIESWKLSEISHNEISWRNARKGFTEDSKGNNVLCIEDIKIDAEKVRPYDSIYDMYYDEFDDMGA